LGNGSALSWRLSSQGQNVANIEHAPDGLFIDHEEASYTSADNALDSAGQDWSVLDATAAPLLEGRGG
jgi:hypothetical protein